MELEEEYKRNRTSMKKIKKQDTQCFIVYIVNLMFLLFSVFIFIGSGQKLYLAICAIIVGASASGFFSVLKKNFPLSIISASLFIIEVILIISEIGFELPAAFGFGVLIYYSVVNVLNCKKYEWISQQDGFPIFELKQKEYEMKKALWDIKDPYTKKKEDIEKRNSDSGDMPNI